MNEITLIMALADFIPVALCAVVVAIQMRDFYPRMRRSDYTLFAAGAVMLVTGGFLKALWKLLYALKICDFPLLSEQFFPTSSIAFVLLAAGMIRMLTAKQQPVQPLAAAVPVMTSHIPFIAVMFLGMSCWYTGLAVFAFRRKKKLAGMMFILAWVIMTAKSGLGSKFDSTQGVMHWIAESINILAHILLLMGTVTVHKALLAETSAERETVC